jgi:[acyl-carrier-protein] S-malonyltransferase
LAAAMKSAYVFPGQGSQSVGMGLDLYQNYAAAKAVFEQADKSLGFPISKLCFEGPEEELIKTVNAQPAIVTGKEAG